MGESQNNHPEPRPGEAQSAAADELAASSLEAPTRVLIAHPSAKCADALAAMLADRHIRCCVAVDIDAALSQLDGACDVALVADALPSDGASCIADAIRFEELPARVILLSRRPTIARAVRAMRSGVCDLLADPPTDADLIASVMSAADAAKRIRARRDELQRLRDLSQRLDSAHAQIADHLDALCDDLSKTCASLTEQVDETSQAAELEARLTGVLDVEAVLRIVLEHILSRVGPTNAAIFLPGESGDFNLGAYVNYDCDKDSADILLDHLADVLAPAFRDENAIVTLESAAEQEQWLGDEASWLADYDNLLVASCRSDDDCLAVIALFREATSPFGAEAIETVDAVREAFARQMSRIVRVHHRLAPRDGRAGWDGASDEEGGLAA